MVVHRQQRVDEGLLAYGFLELPVDGGLEPDEPHEGEHEEDADDPAGADEVLDRVHRSVGGEGEHQATVTNAVTVSPGVPLRTTTLTAPPRGWAERFTFDW